MGKRQVISSIMVMFLLIGITACSLPGKASANDSLVTVKRGDLIVSVSGSGNLATYQDTGLSFGSAGKVAEVLRKEGDRVSKGDVLARLETDALEMALTEAQVNVAKAEVAVTQAELAVNQEPAIKDKARIAVNQAAVALQTAELELDKAQNIYKWPDIEIQQANVDRARFSAKYTQDRLAAATTDEARADWRRNMVFAETNLVIEGQKLNAMQSGADTEEVAIKKRQVEIAQQSMELAKQLLAIELQPREAAQQSLMLAKETLALAQQSQKLAQKRLNDAVITAPFDGVVADMKVKSGDLVEAATMCIYLVKPTLLEVVVEVDEMDIPKVAERQQVKISVDALQDKEFTGTVASVYPVPTKVTGLVMYNVKISLTVPEDAGLMIGMRTTANIIIDKKTGIIKLPNQAIKADGQGGYFVNVIVNKKTEKRPVIIGLNNGTDTEIITGLKEGETVVN